VIDINNYNIMGWKSIFPRLFINEKLQGPWKVKGNQTWDAGGRTLHGAGNGLNGTRVCMVVYSNYPKDQRVRREVEVLEEHGAEVHVICVRNGEEGFSKVNRKTRVYRVPLGYRKNLGSLHYFSRYLLFLFLSTIYLKVLFAKYRYKVIHVHSLPDYLVFCAFVPKMFGARIILDLHELMPEVFAAKFQVPLDSKKVSFVKALERKSTRFADLVVTTSDLRKDALQERIEGEVAVVMNLPKTDMYTPRDMTDVIEKYGLKNSFVVIYVGGLFIERELDVVIKAIKHLEDRVPNIKFILCGSGEEDYTASLEDLIKKLNLKEKVLLVGQVPHDDVLNYINISNVTLVPYKHYPKLETVLDGVSSTKVFEYLLIPKPVISSDLSTTQKEFAGLISFYKHGDFTDLGERLYEVYQHEDEFIEMARRAKEKLFERYDPDRNEQNLVDLYKDLLA
jgi:glycosyltransferase involved in cell wall biosynthesis